MTLLMDTREPQAIAMELQRLKIPIERKQLESGDYIVGNIAVERKAMEDFRNSIINGRIWEQAATLKGNYERCIVVLVGFYPDPKDRKFYPYFLQLMGGTFGLMMGYGIPVMNVPTDSVFSHALAHLYVRTGRTVAFEKPVVRKHAESVHDIRNNMLTQIKGIGRVKADRILQEAHNMLEVCNLDRTDLVRILNLKSKTDIADRILEVMNGPKGES